MIYRLIRKYVILYLYYIMKKNDLISDIIVPVWMAELREKDIKSYRTTIYLPNGSKASVMVIDVGELGFFCKNVHLNIEYIDDYKFISHCNFREFLKYYGDTFTYILDNDGVIDIKQLGGR